MQSIFTLTLNPAVDKSSEVNRVNPDRKLRCSSPKREPGGGGINVARAIHRLGGQARAVYTCGGAIGDILTGLLGQEDVDHEPVHVENQTRENLIIYEKQGEQQFRFGMPGPELQKEEWQSCLDRLRNTEPAPDFLVASGSLPPGVPNDFYGRLADIGRDRGIKVIIDTSGPPLRKAAKSHVYLLKPNVRELEDLADRSLSNEEEQRDAARYLIDQGRCEIVVLSLGAGGAMVVTSDECRFIRSPTVRIRSKVGAGDSMVAGIVLSLARGLELPAAVRFGVAAGAAAVMTAGSELCRRDDTERLFEAMEDDSS